MAYIDSRIERDIILEDLGELAEVQRLMVEDSLLVNARIFLYQTQTSDVYSNLKVHDIINTESLRMEVFKLRSLVCDYTRTKHGRWFTRLFYREYSQRLAAVISERFLEEFPRTSQSRLNHYVNDTNRKLYTELVSDIVFDVLLTPIVTSYDKTYSNAQK